MEVRIINGKVELEGHDFIVCQECGKVCNTKRGLNIHYNRIHKISVFERNQKRIKQGIKEIDYVVCPICGFCYKELVYHLKSKHNMNIVKFKNLYPNARTINKKLYGRFSKANKKAWTKKTPEEIEAWSAKRKATMDNWSEEEKEQYHKNMLAVAQRTAIIKANWTDEERNIHSEIMSKAALRREASYSPEKRMVISQNISKGTNARPTGLEAKIIAIIQSCQLPFFYTGDYRFFIGNGKTQLNPDFIHHNEKIVLELNSYRFHKKEDEQQEIDAYTKHGWQCIVVWEDELNNEEQLIQKIREIENEF